MEQYGNQSTYNLETVLKQNINNADFYKNDCLKLNSWSDVVDQIFYQVGREQCLQEHMGMQHADRNSRYACRLCS